MKQGKRKEKAPEYNFLMIKEKDFPNLFENPVVRGQKMSEFYDEIDYASDEETINNNRETLLKGLQ